jgi:hypothetical protein
VSSLDWLLRRRACQRFITSLSGFRCVFFLFTFLTSLERLTFPSIGRHLGYDLLHGTSLTIAFCSLADRLLNAGPGLRGEESPPQVSPNPVHDGQGPSASPLPPEGLFTLFLTQYFVTEPVLFQASLISLAASIVFSAFWTSSTFLLGDVYGYDSLTIGLFALIGVAGVLAAPFIGRLVDGLVSWVGVLVGIAILAVSQVIFTAAAGVSVVALGFVIFRASSPFLSFCSFLLLRPLTLITSLDSSHFAVLDIGMQLQQVSNSTRIFAINPAARARFSACFLVATFAGQLIGTSAGTRVYLKWGYRASGGLCVGLCGFMRAFSLFSLLLFPSLPHINSRHARSQSSSSPFEVRISRRSAGLDGQAGGS